MNLIRYVLFFVADIVLIGCLVSYFYMTMHDPVRLALFDTQSGRTDYRYYAWLIACWIGFAIFIYHGVAFLFSWMPWGGYDEDDEFRTWAQYLAGTAAFFGSMAMMEGLTKTAHKFNELEIENEALRHSVDNIQKQIQHLDSSLAVVSAGHSTKTVGQTLDELEKETIALQRKWFIRERFKENPPPFVTRPTSPEDRRQPKCYYRVDVEPSLQLIEIMRRLFAIPEGLWRAKR
jgi:hypothetical protein